MIDCSSPREKSDASGKSCSFSFFFLKRRIRGLPRKAVINVLSAGNPIPRANEGGIYHGADVTVTALQVAGNNLFSFLVMVRKSTDVSGVKKKKTLNNDTSKYECAPTASFSAHFVWCAYG